MSKATHLVTVGGRRLEYRRYAGAKPDAPTMVLLHEGLGSVSMWGDFPARAAHAAGCAVVAYSRFGYGHSDARVASYPVEYMHEEAQVVLPELLERLEIAEPILLGHSNGAEIAIIHAGTNERVKGLVVEAPHVFLEDVTFNAIAAAKVAFETTDLPRKLGRHHADAEMAFRGWNDIWLHPDFRRWNIEEYLPRIKCPVLAIQGYDDEYGTMVHLEAIASQVRGPVELLKLAHCGHSPHRDQPQAVLEALTRFVARLAG
ncbi:MAG: alpha/beta hydrolase [Betaproteobacteria bacterium RBG_16_64_18]|nr:MAG: alpha/beta hydrolase [Betaproteobacteria bacterium RBG_16_64_18]